MTDIDLLTFQPLFAEDEETILARWRGWANEGLDPAEDVDQWTDTREGSHWWAATTPPRREAARLYDLAGTEVVASGFPQWSWGEYLDDHGELRSLARLSATPAGGMVTLTGVAGTTVYAGTVVGVEPAEPGAPAPEYRLTADAVIGVGGTIDAPVEAVEAGTASRVNAGAINSIITPVSGLNAVTNAAPIVGGSDTETDAALRDRLIASFGGSAVANLLYYRLVALDEPGVGRVTVIPAADGPGTITIVISAADGTPVTPAVVASLQTRVDPNPGQGAGEGQVGATITVETSALLPIDVDATVEPEVGYTLDGAGGTIALRTAIEAALARYIATVPTGGEVVRQKVVAAIMDVRGVHDVGGVTLNTLAANIPVPSAPAQVPALGDTTGIVEGAV